MCSTNLQPFGRNKRDCFSPVLGERGLWHVDNPIPQPAHGFLLAPQWSISYRFWVIWLAPKAFPSTGPSDPDTMTMTAQEPITSSSANNGNAFWFYHTEVIAETKIISQRGRVTHPIKMSDSIYRLWRKQIFAIRPHHNENYRIDNAHLARFKQNKQMTNARHLGCVQRELA